MKQYKSFHNDRLFYESTFNLLYVTQNYYPVAKKNSLIKRESNPEKPFSNLFIWDINTQHKSALFSDELAHTEQIQKILFEKEYDEKNQCLIFNSDAHLLNKRAIPFRNLKNKLLVETYHPDSGKHHLWLSTKQGKNISKIATIGMNAKWHLDVGNSAIRIIEYLNTDIKVQEIPW